jgi:hypothetical protein
LEINLSMGLMECFHMGNLIYIQQAGVFASREVVCAQGMLGSTTGFLWFTVRGVWADTMAGGCSQNFYINVLLVRVLHSPCYSLLGRWLPDKWTWKKSEIAEGGEKGVGLYCERYTNHTQNKCPNGTHTLRDEWGTDCWCLWAFTGVLHTQKLLLNRLYTPDYSLASAMQHIACLLW